MASIGVIVSVMLVPATATVADLSLGLFVEIGPAWTMDDPFFADDADRMQGTIQSICDDGDVEVTCGARAVFVPASRLIIVNFLTGARRALRDLPEMFVL